MYIIAKPRLGVHNVEETVGKIANLTLYVKKG
jgi:hypothetical protein